MLTDLLDLLGVVCVAGFVWFVWPPLVLAVVGVALLVASWRAAK